METVQDGDNEGRVAPLTRAVGLGTVGKHQSDTLDIAAGNGIVEEAVVVRVTQRQVFFLQGATEALEVSLGKEEQDAITVLVITCTGRPEEDIR